MSDLFQVMPHAQVQLPHVLRDEVAQLLVLLEVPQLLRRVKFRGVGRQQVQVQPRAVDAERPEVVPLCMLPRSCTSTSGRGDARHTTRRRNWA